MEKKYWVVLIFFGIIVSVIAVGLNEQKQERIQSVKEGLEIRENDKKYWDLTTKSTDQVSTETKKYSVEEIYEIIESGKTEVKSENLTRTIPESCRYVSSIETELYPTGEQCLEELDSGIMEYCLSQNNGNQEQAWGCFGKIYALIDNDCKDSEEQGFLSISYEVCFFENMVMAYEKLTPLTNP